MYMNKKNEKGSISVLLAFFLVAILLFIGFAVDLGMLYYKQLRLKEVGNMIRNARFNEELIIEYSDTPNKTFSDIAQDYAKKNGLRADQVRTDFTETSYTDNYRSYELNIYLTDTYQYTALRLLGYTQQNIKVTIHGYGHINDANGPWKPGL